MNLILWILAGGILGWASYAYLHFNQERGAAISVVIGAIGGFAGGKIVAPLFAAHDVLPGDFNSAALFFAVGAAAACVYLGHFVSRRWGV